MAAVPLNRTVLLAGVAEKPVPETAATDGAAEAATGATGETVTDGAAEKATGETAAGSDTTGEAGAANAAEKSTP